MRTADPIQAELHRARTALRDTCMAYGLWASRRMGLGRRTWQQAGRDALAHLDRAIGYLTAVRASLAAALERETAPAATGAAHDPSKEITSK